MSSSAIPPGILANMLRQQQQYSSMLGSYGQQYQQGTMYKQQQLAQQNITSAVSGYQGTAAAFFASGGGALRSSGSSGQAYAPMTTTTLPSSPGGSSSDLLGAAQSGVSTQQLISNAITAQAHSSYGGTDDPDVFVGNVPMGGMGGQATNVPQFQKLSALSNAWFTMDQGQRDKFEAQAALAGYKIDTMSDAQLGALWGAYAGQAAAYTANGKNMSIWDVLAMDQSQRKNAKPTTTSSNTSYNISSYADAHAIFQQAAQSLLGRAPSAAETKAFQQQLNAYEKANPTKTTQTTTTDAMGNSTSSSTSSGGVTAAGQSDIAQQAAQQNPDYGSYQAATTYFNALLGAIGHM